MNNPRERAAKIRQIGGDNEVEQWLLQQQSPVLKVPSAIIPVEFNYLLNPQHPDLKFVLEPSWRIKRVLFTTRI